MMTRELLVGEVGFIFMVNRVTDGVERIPVKIGNNEFGFWNHVVIELKKRV